MPVAIIMDSQTIPAIISGATDLELLNELGKLTQFNSVSRLGVEETRKVVEAQAAPGGWFEDVEAAKAYIQQYRIETDGQLIRAAKQHFENTLGRGVSQRELTSFMGLQDPGLDGSPVRKILSGKNGLGNPSRRALAYALKYGPMTEAQESEILDDVDGGQWRLVDRGKIRRVPTAKN